jgi:hypothetical protein
MGLAIVIRSSGSKPASERRQRDSDSKAQPVKWFHLKIVEGKVFTSVTSSRKM